MGFFSFIKDAGSKLLGLDDKKVEIETTTVEENITPNYEEAINNLKSNVASHSLEIENFDICINEATGLPTKISRNS